MKSGTHPRVFVDSNVWFSAFHSSLNCQKILISHEEGQINAVISQQVLGEVVKHIRMKIPDMLPHFQNFMVTSPPEIVADSLKIPKEIMLIISDQKDQPIFTSAIVAEVDYFITGNIKDFKRDKLEKMTKIKIQTPVEAVKFFKL